MSMELRKMLLDLESVGVNVKLETITTSDRRHLWHAVLSIYRADEMTIEHSACASYPEPAVREAAKLLTETIKPFVDMHVVLCSVRDEERQFTAGEIAEMIR